MADYAGEVFSGEAFKVLSSDTDSYLVTVRTNAELAFVGVEDLKPLNKEVLHVEWIDFPSGSKNPNFESELKQNLDAAGASAESKIFFICRSGARSRAAAKVATSLGYTQAYNVSDGFEGDLDADNHRNTRNGWRHSGLPWRQS